MNQVYLSGIVAETPIQIGSPESPAHTVFRLNVSHRNNKGEWRRELYSINSWNAAAQWVFANLRQGQRVALVGYLTQRVIRKNDNVSVVVEVTSNEFLPLANKMRVSIDVPEDTQASPPEDPASDAPLSDDELQFDDLPDELLAG